MSYSVKEVSNLTDVTIRTLRYYDEINLLPIERNGSNHRVYNTMDILKLSMIRSLKEIGISLDEIREILENNSESIDDILLLQEQIIDMKLERLKTQKSKLELMISQRKKNKSIEEILLNEYIDFDTVDVDQFYNHIKNKKIDFDYYFMKIYKHKEDRDKAEAVMKTFIRYINDEYQGYFTVEKLKELAVTYRTEQSKVYFERYGKAFHLYISDLLLVCLDDIQ
ncbi:MerR family transcriptional regulator [Salinicoccus sp. ID82-1]|uniref:MerR family transcriptional regulator n=1 Tax=Salinicoccus cyprini TaxID=2493691 RepID=A0A558AU51_9STAP|nr:MULTISPECIES: MerR family transcriptional regulator [Salinicoccus]MCG1010719.1 MerR family transcriptional regulator [Salinicoccus sp. ID82-1]TVT27788.1 MerR family transcriptional regulator [Salinicoccus cyprini]